MLSYQVEQFGQPLAQVLRETPAPQGTEVILRVQACGVCHSDVHLQDGYFDLGGGNKVDLTRSLRPPRTLGHEIAGKVVAVGPDAHGVAVGDVRVAFPWIGCGVCPLCQAGDEHLCAAPRNLGINLDGGFADHVVVPHAKYLLDFAPLDIDQACTYACSGLTAFGALKKLGNQAAQLNAGGTLLVIGAGGVGLNGIRLGKLLYPKANLVVAELDKGKWDMARAAGAQDVIDPTAPGAVKELLKATGGVVAAIDFVGAASTFEFGFATVRKGGHLVSVGLFGGNTTLAPAMLALKVITISGSYVGNLQDLRELLELARRNPMPDLPLATQPLANADQVVADLKAGKIKGRTILKP